MSRADKTSLAYIIQIVSDVEVTIGNYFPDVGNTARRRIIDHITQQPHIMLSSLQKTLSRAEEDLSLWESLKCVPDSGFTQSGLICM